MNNLLDICNINYNSLPNDKNIQTGLVETGLRWVTTDDQKLKILDPCTFSKDPKEALDQFIDRHLYYLPIPRYASSFPTSEYTYDPEIVLGSVISTCAAQEIHFDNDFTLDIPSMINDDKFLNSCDAVYKHLVPCIDVLRDESISLQIHACILVILGLDPTAFKDVPLKEFKKLSLYRDLMEDDEAILQIISIIINANKNENNQSISNMLQQADIFIENRKKQHYIQLLPKASTSWTPWTTIRNMQLLPDETTESQIYMYHEKYNLDKDFLISKAAIKDITDDQLEIGFFV